jgi:hypothetical protein
VSWQASLSQRATQSPESRIFPLKRGLFRQKLLRKDKILKILTGKKSKCDCLNDLGVLKVCWPLTLAAVPGGVVQANPARGTAQAAFTYFERSRYESHGFLKTRI